MLNTLTKPQFQMFVKIFQVLKLEISLSFDKKYFARKSLSFRNIFAISIRLI